MEGKIITFFGIPVKLTVKMTQREANILGEDFFGQSALQIYKNLSNGDISVVSHFGQLWSVGDETDLTPSPAETCLEVAGSKGIATTEVVHDLGTEMVGTFRNWLHI